MTKLLTLLLLLGQPMENIFPEVPLQYFRVQSVQEYQITEDIAWPVQFHFDEKNNLELIDFRKETVSPEEWTALLSHLQESGFYLDSSNTFDYHAEETWLSYEYVAEITYKIYEREVLILFYIQR